ncbi:HTH-type transcriptional activator RhaR [Paenibacillus solanacearum]|uniref:HTH-type transcriptional activator RhaR n=1 Tax=Paenibacillus solanacearum TaxID=2048548 RepID=A0A916K9H6_9BACL|nr:helix-turn-helix domain-containing protein [Paenibacillus solanacearum]CAG7647127.1 HTH-type transcriptional activator RhaR [Paenibacillus solanacearum]
MPNDIGQLVIGLPAPYREINFFYRTKGWTMGLHDHPWYQMILVTDGVLSLESGDHSYTLRPGHFCLIPPFHAHALATKDGYHQFGINFQHKADERGITSFLDTHLKEIVVMNKFDILDMLPAIQQTCSEMTAISKLRVGSYLDSILLNCMESAFSRKEIHFRNKLLDYLRRNLREKTMLKDLCQHMNMSQSHLERLTYQEFGCGVIELYNRIRIHHACNLLSDSSLSLSEISEQLGFYDLSHFSHFFKRKMRMSPTAFKKQMLE